MTTVLPTEPLLEPAKAVRSVPGPPAVVLIGCGAVARLFYRPALLELIRRRELHVAALVDPSAEARAALATHFPRAESVARVEHVAAPEGSLAIVASPPRFHAAQTGAALDRSWHVLCEKPMAATAADCEGMIRAAAAARRVLAVGLYKRFYPSSVFLRSLCRDGALGPLRTVDIQEGGRFEWPAASPSFFQRRETPGGVLLDIGVHVLDLLLWCLGEPSAFDYRDDAMGGLEVNALLDLRYPGGATARIRLSRDWPTAQSYRFEFERGSVSWTVNEANRLTLRLDGLPAGLQGTLVDEDDRPAGGSAHCFIAQLQNVLAAMRGSGTPRAGGDDGARVVRLIESCYARRRWLDQPWLEPAETERARQLGTPSPESA